MESASFSERNVFEKISGAMRTLRAEPRRPELGSRGRRVHLILVVNFRSSRVLGDSLRMPQILSLATRWRR